MINACNQAKDSAWLQALLLRSFFAIAENSFVKLLPSRNPFCLIALEENKVIGYIVIQPYNIKGTCWSITFPKILQNPKRNTSRDIYLALFKSALEFDSSRSKSWVVRCSANNNEQLAIARELGFQPLKLFQYWNPSKNIKNKINYPISSLPEQYEWQQLTRRNAPILWSLEQTNLSAHLRQISDRHWRDLLNQKKECSGVLLSRKEGTTNALAGLISQPGFKPQEVIQLLRDFAWDNRLSNILPSILSKLPIETSNFQLETTANDLPINEILEKYGWEKSNEEILLGRSLWRRKSTSKLTSQSRALESMLGRLQPQQPQLPTPSLERR